MFKQKLIVSALLSISVSLSPVFAADAKKDDTAIDNTVVATINGEKIIVQELIMTAEQNKVNYASLNIKQKGLLLQGLINRQLVAMQAKKEKFDKSEDMQLKLKALNDSIIAASFLEQRQKDYAVSDEELQAKYQKNVKDNAQTQYKARHILVKEEAKAKEILEKVQKGEDFAKLAKENSADKGSAEKGGDLGWFNPRVMVPEFAAAVTKATKGELPKELVKSTFGYHIIIVDDSKPIDPPSFEDSKQKLESIVIKEKLSKYLEQLNQQYKVEVMLK